jgi:indole-3-glycerol phosphate synthase
MTKASTTSITGVRASGGILDKIVQAKVQHLDEAKRRTPIEELAPDAAPRAASRAAKSMVASLRSKERVNIIAEIKQRSPSKGIIRADFNPEWIAGRYAMSGAAAISVLTEEDFFEGSLEHLRAVRGRVELPLLRKDFVFDEYQLPEALKAGADAVLLIVAILEDFQLARLITLAREFGLDALVEVHSADEMHRAVDAGASIIGVNNRDLTTFNVDLETSIELARLAPRDAILVSESGIKTGGDLRRLREAGFNAFLFGELLMRANDPGDALERLIAEANAES